MELNEYQKKALTTCMTSCDNFMCMMLNLMGEVGEFAGKIAKDIRKSNAVVKYNELEYYGGNENPDLKQEAGDILWQLASLCYVMGWRLDDVARENLEKLASRKERGVIDGDGDNR